MNRKFVAVLASAFLSACTVGPDYAPPAAPVSQHYDRQAEDRLSLNGKIDADWWSAFHSPKLDQTMQKAIDGSFDLAIADARLAQASEGVRAAAGGLYPQVDFGDQIGRARTDTSPAPSTSSFYAVGPVVSFDLDIFGGTKRQIEQQEAAAEAERHRFDAAWLTLTGDVASQAILFASAQAQIDAVQVLLADDRKNLDLLRTAHLHGGVALPDVALAETQLAQDETLLPPLAQQRDAARHALSVLAGQGPADWIAPDFALTDFELPSDLPVSLPSELAHDRPDILEAESKLHASSAAIGVATADMYPHLTLSGSVTQAGVPFQAGTALWSTAAGLAGPIFHGGTLEANRQGAVDGYQASLAAYRRTVVRSLGQVADVLQALNHDSEEYWAQERSLGSAGTSLRLSRDGYRVGETGALQVLESERAYQRAVLGEIRVKTARYLDSVQLFVALGGNSKTGGYKSYSHSPSAANQ